MTTTVDPKTKTALDEKISRLAVQYRGLAVKILKEAIRIPADYVDRSPDDGGDPRCGLSNHELPRLEYLKRTIIEERAVEKPEDVWFDGFGNLRWIVAGRERRRAGREEIGRPLRRPYRHRQRAADSAGTRPSAAASTRTTDGSTARRSTAPSWRQSSGTSRRRTNGNSWSGAAAPPISWRASSAEIVATKIMLECKAEGALKGVIVHGVGTVAEEDNDGGGPMFICPRRAAGRSCRASSPTW